MSFKVLQEEKGSKLPPCAGAGCPGEPPPLSRSPPPPPLDQRAQENSKQ